MAEIFRQAFVNKLIYVYRINDEAHEGILKIGEATCDASAMSYLTLAPNCKELNDAAKKRIRHQTQTAGILAELLYTEITAYEKDKNTLAVFQDHEVHEVLKRSGIKQKTFATDAHGHKANEWFYIDLETVKKAIAAVKSGRTSLKAGEISKDRNPVVFRPEQKEAISKTVKQFKKKTSSGQMLWNAKMRFGKTLSALQVIKEMDFCRTLILTHRPVVDEGWFTDYKKIFYDRDDFEYYSKKNGGNISSSEDDFYEKVKAAQKSGLADFHFIYFASIQDMRGSEIVGGKFSKNEDIFGIDWDLIIIDEAHEGTQTELGKSVIAKCKKGDTKILHLSGTPFNLMSDFKEEEIYTWDYVMEQRAKAEWDKVHEGDPNPYAVLPKMNIFTYDLGELFAEYAEADIAFNFREFFRVDADGNFIHQNNVKQFLDLISKEDDKSNYPYATKEYRENFRHSLWMIPGVKEAKALSALLQGHPVFSQFNIANVAGDGDEEQDSADALKLVEKAIGKKPEESYSITLSCGRLTTGVSVKPWTACFMLSGSYNTAASTYMQTIFRVQTPAVIGGKQKEECFVFDFAPDRTLKVIAEAAKISAKAGKTSNDDRIILGDFLNFCPIIGFDGSRMKAYDTEKMLGELKKVYVERVVQNGFEDGYLYNDDLLRLDNVELKAFEDLKKIIGTTKAMAKTGEITINELGFTEEDYAQTQSETKTKKPETLTAEQMAELEKRKLAKKNRDTAVSILRGISIRMPLLIYGADLRVTLNSFQGLDAKEIPKQVRNDKSGKRNDICVEAEITLDNFTELVDDLSWKEFMPNGVTKEKFNEFKKYYDKDVFRESALRIRQMTRAADSLPLEERIERVASIFATFRNPDKETVLTPWRVVNMHIADTLGGYRFFDSNYKEALSNPEYTEQKGVSTAVYKKNSKILEINAKSGLYALFCAYSLYRARAKLEIGPKATREMQKALWQKVLAENIFVICKTPMAKSITKRTLSGFTDAKVNAHYFEDLVGLLKHKPENFISKVKKRSYWKLGTRDEVIGNRDEGRGNRAVTSSVANPVIVGLDPTISVANEIPVSSTGMTQAKQKTQGDEEMKFDAIVGNPPYQEETIQEQSAQNGQAARTNIFHYFQMAADAISEKYVSLIYPGARWIHRSGKGLAQFGLNQINDVTLEKVDFYPNSQDVFKDVDIPDGLTIVLKDKNKTKSGFTYVYHENNNATTVQIENPGENLIPLNPNDGKIISKIVKFVEANSLKYLHERILPRSLFGIESNFVENNPKSVKVYDENSKIDFTKKIKLLANDRAGAAGRSKWFIADKQLITQNAAYIGEYQVVVSSAHPGGQEGRDNQIEIIDNHSAFGRSRVALGSFKTEIEAKNFYKYLNSTLIKFMFLMTDEALTSLGKKVPDIVDYSMKNKIIDFTKDIDAQLFALVDLSEDEQKYVESVIDNLR